MVMPNLLDAGYGLGSEMNVLKWNVEFDYYKMVSIAVMIELLGVP